MDSSLNLSNLVLQQVAAGYYNMPEKTKEEFFTENGIRWFRTGDIGQMMQDGTIKIVDRKKDLVKMQGGEYVSLGKVESLLKIHPAVENICVFGDSTRSNPVALVVPGEVWMQKALVRLGKDNMSRAEACLDPEVVADVLEKLEKHAATQKLQRFEIPDKIFLVAEPWTPESGDQPIPLLSILVKNACFLFRSDHCSLQVEEESIGKYFQGGIICC